jgi:hypothetical protein
LKVPLEDIEERSDDGPSLMPEGLVDALSSRDQFLDLERFLIEVHEGGPERARALRPSAPSDAPVELPDYEKDLDHAGLIQDLGSEALKRGEAIFQRVCANCHGTKDAPGSLPSAPRFALPGAVVRNGNDPFSLYRTLTYGFGQMPPQSWLVPSQRYDVIHYLREVLLKEANPSHYARVDGPYLASLPKGQNRGPAPSAIEPWVAMDYGRAMMATIEVGQDASNIAYKGIAVRVDPGPGGVSAGRAWALYEHDTMRLAALWTGKGFINWEGINFDGRHQVHPRVEGDVQLANPAGPGWANPADGRWDDTRLPGRDGRRYGPLPSEWARFRGVHYQGERIVLEYEIGGVRVLESPGLDAAAPSRSFERRFEIGPRDRPLAIQLARLANGQAADARVPVDRENALVLPDRSGVLVTSVDGETSGLSWQISRLGDLRLEVPAGNEMTLFTARMGRAEDEATRKALIQSAKQVGVPVRLSDCINGGPSTWPGSVRTRIARGANEGSYAVDVLGLPIHNPWNALVRPTGFDFLSEGEALVCTWDGDVWHLSGLDQPVGDLTWRRVASGLFQPLGLKVVDRQAYVSCRDQIVALKDLDGDGSFEFLECFNSDHQVTEHFHEFALGLQADRAGNLYYAKAARHGLPAVVPHHGTLLKVLADGSRTEILATGFRAPNGVCLNDDGTFFVTDQEGFWLPKNRINWVRPGTFHGNMWGYHDVRDPSDEAMEPPVCWITNRFDRSPGEMLRVEGDRWGLPPGTVLQLSYGEGKVFVVPHERVGDKMQGGMCALPIPTLPTGVMRGRFRPEDGQLYACGMFAWAGNRTLPGGMYRIRHTGQGPCMPLGLHPRESVLEITFSKALDVKSAGDPKSYQVRVWALKRTQNYGSEHINEHPLEVKVASLSDDGRTISLRLPELAPTWCMEVVYEVRDADGKVFQGAIHNTIHELGP